MKPENYVAPLVGAMAPFPGLCPLGLAAATKMATCARQMACACAEGGAPPLPPLAPIVDGGA